MASKSRVKQINFKVYAMGIDSGNDPSGSPKRGWLLFKPDGSYCGFLDEGYHGKSWLLKVAPKAVELVNLVPTKSGYWRELMKEQVDAG